MSLERDPEPRPLARTVVRGSRTACVLVIGNEILTGKVQDANAHYLSCELRQLGVELRRIVVVPDVIDEIADEVRLLSARHDFLFTSGGVGPTHDDVTIAAVARAFDCRVVRDPGLESLVRGFYAERLTPHHLRMADVPEGAELIAAADVRWPVVAMQNVYILPGIPEIFRKKFESVRERFRSAPFYLRMIYTLQDEGLLGPHLDATVAAYPDVEVGSYPRLDTPRFKVKVTLESKDEAQVERAAAFLLGRLPPETVVDPEAGS